MKLRIVSEAGGRFYIKSDASEFDRNNDPKTAKEALRVSIEKWSLIAALLRGNDQAIIGDGGITTCGLCVKFFDAALGDQTRCAGCPVAKVSGKISCGGTPYQNWTDRGDLEHAEAELAFLMSLDVPEGAVVSSKPGKLRDTRGRFAKRP